MGTKILLKLKYLYYSFRLFIHELRNKTNSLFYLISSFSCLSIIVLLFLEFGFNLSQNNTSNYLLIHLIIIYFFIIDTAFNILFSTNRSKFLITHTADLIISLIVIYTFIITQAPIAFNLSQLLLLLGLIGRVSHLNLFIKLFKIRPAQTIILGFLFVIFIGSLMLSLPIASTSNPLSFVDALFTSFSAVCVTGLVVNDISTDLTFFGQLIILFLIQIGGLGIMSFSVILMLISGKKISQSETLKLQESYSTFNYKETLSAISFIFKFTLFFELLGTILLSFFLHEPTTPLSTTIFMALFHSVSAFCNAGFSLFSTSLIGFQFNIPIILIISALIILGGLGFPVLFNLSQRYLSKSKTPLKMQTTLALKVTLGLIIFGTLFLFFTEKTNSLGDLSNFEQLSISFFQSVSARTAGFNTFDISSFHQSSILCLIILMIIGASPVSTAGGIKTTTFGLIFISFINILKSSYRFDYNKKTIDPKSILNAFATLFTAIIIIFLASIILLKTEILPSSELIFETVSAFGTVGLSLGATPFLSTFGKITIMLTMFVGRIGPFVFLYAFFNIRKTKSYSYPVEKVSIV